MRLWRQWLLPLAGLLLVLAAFGWLFTVRLGGGDVYPEYSSLRADALGTRALYEGLAQLPGMQVERDYRPLSQLGVRARLIVLPGLRWQDWQSIPANVLEKLNAAVRNGARVVLAFRADLKRAEADEAPATAEEAKEKAEKKAREAEEAKKKKKHRPALRQLEPKDLA